jgi:hypothetical protein
MEEDRHMKTSGRATTGRMILAAAMAGVGLLAAADGACAQVSRPRDAPPPGVGEVPQAAGPRGAVFIPGVGYRFVQPPGPRVYGWYYGPRVYSWSDDRETRRFQNGYRAYGYRARRVGCDRDSTWYGDRCVRRFQ